MRFTVADREDAVSSLAAGEELLPGYRVVSLMRRGNDLDTYDVLSTERDCRCVIKVLRTDRQGEVAYRSALVREGTLLRDLAHPHLVRAYELVEQPRTAVVLETLSGATLAALIEQGPLDPREAALLGRQLTSVLSYLHQRHWLHLDVKPSNVVVQAGRAILIDLSLATRPGDGRPHAGTSGYLAPEQVTGFGLTPAADVFGLGVTLGEALTGELAHGRETRWRSGTTRRGPTRAFRRRLAGLPTALTELVVACVDPDPTRRPTLADVRLAIDDVIAAGSDRTGTP